MTSRLRWVKAMVREVLHDGRITYCLADTKGFKSSSQLTRSLKDNQGTSSSRSNSLKERRGAEAADGAYNDLQSRNALKEAVARLVTRVHQGTAIDTHNYVDVLQGCTKQKDLESVEQVHDCIRKSCLEQDSSVVNSLLKGYIRCGKLQSAQECFNQLLNKDIVSWTVMIRGYTEHDQAEDAIEVYMQMHKENGQPDAVTYLTVLKACASRIALKWGKDIHAHVIRDGYQSDKRVCTALIHMYAKCGSIENAREIFDKMEERDIISWTAMIGGLAQHGRGHEAFSLFLQMQREGFTPDAFTYVSILNPCSRTGALEWVGKVHAHAVKAGLDTDLRVGNALVHMYAKIGNIADARQVFDKMLYRDVVSWTSMIGGLAQHGHGREALQLVQEMTLKGGKPNGPFFVAVLSACNHAGLVDEGRFQLGSMRMDYGFDPALEHYTCMVDILGRAGHLEEAKLLLFNMPIKPNVVTWGALLGASRIYNHVVQAELAAEECIKLEPMDPSPYVLLSNLYAAGGKWDQVSSIRSTMQERGVRKDPGLCWIEVDDKVHHFVVGDKSHPEAIEIYAKLNHLFELLKSEGYTPDTRLVSWNINEEDKESALCFHSEKLAIAYGLMHVTPEKPIHIYKNLRMCTDCHSATKLISKITAREIVARDANRFHLFRDGSCSCGDYW